MKGSNKRIHRIRFEMVAMFLVILCDDSTTRSRIVDLQWRRCLSELNLLLSIAVKVNQFDLKENRARNRQNTGERS